MLLAPHFIFSAVLGSKFENPIAGSIFAFVAHFALDAFPHSHYKIDNLNNFYKNPSLKNLFSGKLCLDILKTFIDFGVGVIFVVFLFKNSSHLPLYLFYGFLGDLPDFINYFAKLTRWSILNHYLNFHFKIHWGKASIGPYEKIEPPLLIGLATQVIAVLLAILTVKL